MVQFVQRVYGNPYPEEHHYINLILESLTHPEDMDRFTSLGRATRKTPKLVRGFYRNLEYRI